MPIKEQVLYLEEPCKRACPGCFLARKQSTPTVSQMVELDSEIPTIVTLNDQEKHLMRSDVIHAKAKFKHLKLHCTTWGYQYVQDLHDTFTCSISTKLKSCPVKNQEIVLTVYPKDVVTRLQILVDDYREHNNILMDITKPWAKFDKTELIRILAFAYRNNIPVDECSLFHLTGNGICVAQQKTTAFYFDGQMSHCFYNFKEICDKGILKEII